MARARAALTSLGCWARGDRNCVIIAAKMTSAEETVEACSMNIGPRGRRQRLRFGVVGIIVGVVAGAALIALGAPRLARLALFVPLFVGGMGVFQARAKT